MSDDFNTCDVYDAPSDLSSSDTLNTCDEYDSPSIPWLGTPSAGSTTEVLSWPAVPSTTDANDGTQAYNMGVAFTPTVGKSCTGVQWRVPDTVSSPPGGVHAASIWDDVTNTRVAYKEFTPTPGGGQDVTFDAAVSLTGGTSYIAAIYTVHYVFRASSPVGVTSPSGNLVAGTGRLAAYNGGAASAPVPDDTSSLTFYVSPIVEV